MKGSITGRFYSKLSNVTKSSPYQNQPVICKCGLTIWRWNLENHYKLKHPNDELPRESVVSEFEKKCVEYASFKGHIGKKNFEKLLRQYREETISLFGTGKDTSIEQKNQSDDE